MATGIVKWFNAEKGYGFIMPDDGSKDLFAHYSEICSEGYKSLQENQRVSSRWDKGPRAQGAKRQEHKSHRLTAPLSPRPAQFRRAA